MSDKMNEVVQDIAVKHGVVLGKDDPILILQTINQRLLEENRKAQQEMLAQFKEEMENISSQWKNDANEKAEKVLNAAWLCSIAPFSSQFLNFKRHDRIPASREMSFY